MHRRDIHDPAATALLDHLLRGELRAEEGALEIDLEHLFVLLLGGVQDGRARFDAGVVDQNVEPAECFHGRGDQLSQVVDLADIGFDAHRLIAERRDLFHQRVGRFGMGDIVDDDVGALFRQLQDDRQSNAAVAASDDGDFSLQIHNFLRG